jgi:hypothetical protein
MSLSLAVYDGATTLEGQKRERKEKKGKERKRQHKKGKEKKRKESRL